MTIEQKIQEIFDPAIKDVGEVYSWTSGINGQCGASFAIYYCHRPEMEKRPVFYGVTRREAMKKATEYRGKVFQHMSSQNNRAHTK